MSDVLADKYRPKTFEDVIGHEQSIGSFQRMIAKGRSQAYLLTGPSGVGKTTLARIGAHAAGCHDRDIQEVAAAVFTGVEDMRKLQDSLRYLPFGGSKRKSIILDECHALSRQAWQSLLKILEEPPAHITWFLCTTEVSKVPATIKTRCPTITLCALKEAQLSALVTRVCKREKINLDQDVKRIVVQQANGSARQSLFNLALCQDIDTPKDALEILRAVQESDPTRELCQFLLRGGSWAKAMGIIAKLEDEEPESVRIVVCQYMGAVVKSAKSDDAACNTLRILEAFSTPYHPGERRAPLMISIGRSLFGGE